MSARAAAEPVAAKVVAISTALSPYPASFDNSPVRYAFALGSLMSIMMFGGIVACWMGRDIWRDRKERPPTPALLLFRLMMGTCGFAAFLRCLPEVLYMSAYGEVTGDRMAIILTAKRLADIASLPVVVGWMAILVCIYPAIVIVLRAHRPLAAPRPISRFDRWHHLGMPAVIFVTIVLIASLMAYAKWTLAHAA
jgi:hypothetical protein